MARSTKAPELASSEQIEETNHSSNSVANEKLALNLENDPHRAALEDNPDEAAKVTFRKTLVIFFLGAALGVTIGLSFLLANPLIQPIGEALNDEANIGWIISGWSTSSAVSLSLAGRFSDIFGRKYVILSGQGIVLIGSIVAATAHTVNIVIAGSTIIGFGTGLVLVVFAAIPEILPNKYRGMGVGWAEFCINLPWGVFQTLIATQLAEKASWRWCYYLTIILSVVTMVGIMFTYFPSERPQLDYEKTRLQELWELDWIGMALYAGGLTTFLIGLSWAGTPGHPWDSVSVILLIVLGVVVLFLCFVYDWTIAKNPFFPYSLFSKVREYSVLLVAVFVAGLVFFAMSSTLPQATTYLFNSDGLQIGLIQMPNGFGQILGTIIPFFMHKIKHIRLQLIVALAIQTIFTACYAATIPDHKAAWMVLQFFGNISFSWLTLCAYVTASLNIPLAELGLAIGVLTTFRNSGGAVGIAIFNTIRNSVLSKKVVPWVTEAALANGFPPMGLDELIPTVEDAVLGNPGALRALNGVTPAVESAVIAAFRKAYTSAFQTVFLSTIPFGVIATVALMFVGETSQYLTNHTAVQLEGERARNDETAESSNA